MTYQSIENEIVNYQMFGTNFNTFTRIGLEGALISKLEENTTYVIRVTAINDFGSSPSTNPVQATTKAFTSEKTCI